MLVICVFFFLLVLLDIFRISFFFVCRELAFDFTDYGVFCFQIQQFLLFSFYFILSALGLFCSFFKNFLMWTFRLIETFLLFSYKHFIGTPGWLSGWASAFSSRHDSGYLGSSPTLGFLHGGCFSLCLCLCLSLSLCVFHE